MALPIKPALRPALGMESWGFALAIANINAPTIAELTANGGFNLTLSIFGEQEGVTGTTEKISLPRLLGERATFQSNGTTAYEMADLLVSFQPQAASGADGKKAWTTLTDNIYGFFWHRQDVDPSVDLAAGQFVNIIPTQLGVKIPGKTGNGSDGVFSFTQPASITSTPAWNKAIAA